MIERLQSELAAVRQEMRGTQARKQQAAERLASSRAELDRTAREQVTARDTLATMESSLRDAERQIVEMAGIRDAAEESVAQRDARIAAAGDLLARARADIDTLDRSRGEVLEEIHQLRIAQATCA